MKLALVLMILSTAALAKDEGRFQIVRINEYPNAAFMIDSSTGRIWKQTCYTNPTPNGDCAVRAWAPMDVVGVNVTEKDMWKLAEAQEKREPASK